MKSSVILAAVCSGIFAGAHSIVDEIRAGGVDYPGYNPIHDPERGNPPRIVWAFPKGMNNPVVDVTLPDIACNVGAQPAKLVAPTTAGSKVKFHWQPWPDNHKGPVMTYMANCEGDCKDADPNKLDYFKIDEAGLGSDGVWATTNFIANNLTWTVTIPSDIVAGNYLIRQELVSLHSANMKGKAQFYPMCANLAVHGTGTARPAGVKFPGAYSPDDPGMVVNVNDPNVKTYQIPGPKVYVPGSAPAKSSDTPKDTSKDTPKDTSKDASKDDPKTPEKPIYSPPTYPQGNATMPTPAASGSGYPAPSCSTPADYTAPPAKDAKPNTPPTPDNKYNSPPKKDVKTNTPPAADTKYDTPSEKDAKSKTPPTADNKYNAPPAKDATYKAPTTTFSTVTRPNATPGTETLYELKDCLKKAEACIQNAKCLDDFLPCETQREACYVQYKGDRGNCPSY